MSGPGLKQDIWKYDCVLFDLDGTLVKLQINWQDVREELQRAYAQNGCSVISDGGVSNMILAAAESGYPDARSTAARILHKYESKAAIIKIDETVCLFQSLAQNKQLGVVTNNLHGTAKRVLLALGILTAEVFIVGFDDVQYSKPHPEGILKALGHFSHPQCSVLIGDTKLDQEAAKQAGIAFCMFRQ